MAEPLTKEERDEIVLALAALKQRWGHNTWVEHTVLRYEATVAALEAESADRRDKAFQAVLERMAKIEEAGAHECSTCRSWKERIGDVDPRGPYQEGYCYTLGIDTLNDFSCIYWLASGIGTTGDNPHAQ